MVAVFLNMEYLPGCLTFGDKILSHYHAAKQALVPSCNYIVQKNNYYFHYHLHNELFYRATCMPRVEKIEELLPGTEIKVFPPFVVIMYFHL